MPTLAQREIELHHKYSVELNDDRVSATGIETITQYIRTYVLSDNIFYFPDDWDWHWKVTEKGGFATGTLPKRIAKLLSKEYGTKLDERDATQIGNIAKMNTVPAQTYTFDFTNDFNWTLGEYGDKNDSGSMSCYWKSHSAARYIMMRCGALAARFYNPDGTGMGRIWLAPDAPLVGQFIVFNGYGWYPHDSTRLISQILAAYFEISYHQIRIVNDGRHQGMVWINNGGNGYVLGPTGTLKDQTIYDLNYQVDDVLCTRCGANRHTNNMYYYERRMYCDDCFGRIVVDCCRCHEWVSRDTAVEAHGYHYCATCAAQRLKVCPNCNRQQNKNDFQTGPDGISVCDTCFPLLWRRCSSCGDYHARGTMTTVGRPAEGTGVVCQGCFNQHYVNCVNCGYATHNSLLIRTAHGVACRSCVQRSGIRCGTCGKLTFKKYIDPTTHKCETCTQAERITEE